MKCSGALRRPVSAIPLGQWTMNGGGDAAFVHP